MARTGFAQASKLVALSEIVKLKEWCIFKHFLGLLVFRDPELLKIQVCQLLSEKRESGHTAASNITGTCADLLPALNKNFYCYLTRTVSVVQCDAERWCCWTLNKAEG